MGIAGEGSGQAVEDDEVECLLANQIYKVRTLCPSVGLLQVLPGIEAASSRMSHQESTRLTQIAGSNEGLHLARTRHGSHEQKGRIPGNRGLMPKKVGLLPSTIQIKSLLYHNHETRQVTVQAGSRCAVVCVSSLDAHGTTSGELTIEEGRSMSAISQLMLPIQLKP